jgi:methyl-accepting chemotaxis protein
MRRLKISLRIAIAFAVLLAVVGAVATLVYLNLGILESAKHKTDHATRILAEIGRYGLAMADQETGLRGYVLTEDKGFLKPLRDGEAAARAAQERLSRLIGSKDTQTQRLAMLQHQVEAWQAGVSAVILRDFGEPANAERVYALIRSTEARDMMDGIRASLAAIESHERQILAERSVQQEAAFAHAYRYAAIGLVLLTGFALLAGFLMHGSIALPIRRLTMAMRRLADGNLTVAIAAGQGRDEVAEMADALQVFRENAVAKAALEAESAARSEDERRRAIAERERDRTAGEEIAALVAAVAAGDVTRRLPAEGKDGLFLVMAREINRLTETMNAALSEMGTVLTALSAGDLTRRIASSHDGIFGSIRRDTNGMADKLAGIVMRLSQTATALQSTATEIASGATQLAARTESQSSSLEETAAAMHEVTTTVRHNADNAQAASQLARTARDTAEKGGGVVSAAVAAMREIEDSASRIAAIMGLIDEIAFQTNLLALNASVEAARAGEAGRGSAVVAQEVRHLAQRSANASKDIKALIGTSNSQVRNGVALVNQTGAALGEIVDAVKKVSDIVGEIALASQEQTTGLEQVGIAVGQLDEIAQRNSGLVEETTASAQLLADQASALSEVIGYFRLGAAAATMRTRT